MIDKKELQKIIDDLPKALKLLLNAELAVGNEILEIGHSYPAPAIGAYLKLAKPISTKFDEAKEELTIREHDNSLYSSEYTDRNRRFFIITPPKLHFKIPQRKNSIKTQKTTSKESSQTIDSDQSTSSSPLRRFEKSMEIDYEKWHEGISYDLDAIRSASPTERNEIEQILIHHNPRDWRDIEALAVINTVSAKVAIKHAMNDLNPDVRIAVTRFAPNLITNRERSQSLIKALQSSEIFSGLSQALDDIEDYHPKEIKEVLITGLLNREGEIAVLFAAMLFYLYGKASEPFDMALRPFFLRFNTENKEARLQAFQELCRQLNITPEKYLALNNKFGTKS